jgi:prepilin signal peptidase PulO-like enzyme (type II secretory pathway)
MEDKGWPAALLCPPFLFAMLLLILFVLGTCVGSFLNVCIWRLPRGESVVEPPSHCPSCDTRLQALDLVPLWSQVFLKARCRYCGNTISWRYFGIEFLTGVLFVMVGWRPGNLTGDSWWTAAWTGDAVYLLQLLTVVSCLVVIFWIDYETFLIPLSAALMIGLAGVAGDAWRVTQGLANLTDGAIIEGYPLLPGPLPASILAMVVTATFLWLLRELFSWIYGKEAMGFGDVFLVAAIAANIGWSALLGTFFFLSVMLGAFIGVALRIPRAVRAYRWATARAAKAAANAASPTPSETVLEPRSHPWRMHR